MNELWKLEFWRLLILVVVAVLIGAGTENYTLAALFVIAFYLGLHLRELAKLSAWLAEYRSAPIPESTGAWGRVFDRLRGVQRHHQTDLEDLRRSLGRYRQISKALPDGAVTLGSHDEIELLNDAATALLGLKEPQDVASPITNLVRDPKFVTYMRDGKFEEALEIPSPIDPRLQLLLRVVPYGDVGRKLLLIRDVTRLHRLEEMRRDFIANVSHEMKSPLTVVKGYVESLLDDGRVSGPGQRERLQQIEQQTERMCRIVNDLLTLSNLETGPPDVSVPVDIPALIRSVEKEAEELSQGRHEISTDIDETLFVLGNFNQLYSAFSNLVFNAVHYTPTQGKIVLRWIAEDGGGARFAVTDTGVGIQAEHLPRLTERFYRVDTARSRELGGTGLGLAIVKHVLLRHGAHLIIGTQPGEGSTFNCRFPADRVIDREAMKSSA